jgi:UDP-2,4-diacetamido-2,4,6-trideoxy-beta-L-altropyranose hydrolase
VPFTVAFRVDATPEIGGGHLMRCLTLADECLRRRADVLFVTRVESTAAVPELVRSGFPFRTVTDSSQAAIDAIRACWPAGADALVIDGYGFCAPHHRALRRATSRVMVIDDLADRLYDCDILLDQNLGRRGTDYWGLVPGGCQIVSGTSYALLRPEFAALRQRALARRRTGGDVGRILVSFGLTDFGGTTAKVTQTVLSLKCGAAIDVVVGATAPSLGALRALAARHPEVTLHVDTRHIADLILAADIAVGAAGSSSWERCCLGLPTILVVQAENQNVVADQLAVAGFDVVRDIGADGGALLAQRLATLLHDPERRRAQAHLASCLVDGKGAARVAAQLMATSPTVGREVHVRRALEADSRMLWSWRNDPKTRAVSRTPDEVPWADHSAWFDSVTRDPGRWALICEGDAGPIGTVRFDPMFAVEMGYLVSINLAPERRGRGLGRSCLAAACSYIWESIPDAVLYADIVGGNVVSERIFAACGFVRTGRSDDAGFPRYRASRANFGSSNTGP